MTTSTNYNLDKILPQQHPFRMIDRIVDFKKDVSLTAIKNITGNEWVFDGFGGRGCDSGVFPETLIIEAASQTALCLYQLSKIKDGEKRPRYILGKIKSEWKKPVGIGDQLVVFALANKMLDTGGYSDIQVSSAEDVVGNVEIIYSVIRG